MIGPAVWLVALFGLPGVALFAAAVGNGAERWPWPQGLVTSLALGVTIAGLTAIVLGRIGIFGLTAESLAVAAIGITIAAGGRFRLAWPFARVSIGETIAVGVVAAVASGLFLGRSFEMLIGGRDATLYLVSGVALARQGSLTLHDHAIERIGRDHVRLFYPAKPIEKGFIREVEWVKYPGFYYTDLERGEMTSQGLPLLKTLIAIFYAAFGLEGAFAANNAIGILAVLSVLTAGTLLVGNLGAFAGTMLLAVNLVEVWAARYPVAEILFQMLLFAGLAAFLRRDRLGEGIAGLLLAATLFAKLEAALLILPVGLLAIASALPGGPRLVGRTFWFSFGTTAALAAAYWLPFETYYAAGQFQIFSFHEVRLLHRILENKAVLGALGLAAGGAIAAAILWARSSSRRLPLAVIAGRTIAAVVVLLAIYSYFVRPVVPSGLSGQPKTLVWLSWYVTRPVLLLGVIGLAHSLWTKSRAETLFALVILLMLSVVFLHYTFANVRHIYVTRRFIPAALPMICLFFGYAIALIRRLPLESRGILSPLAAAAVAVGALGANVQQSHHVYSHREYDGLTRQLAGLVGSLRDRDLVFLSDTHSRDLLGPALEFVYGFETVVVRPARFREGSSLIREWVDRGWKLAALTEAPQLENVVGAEDFELVDQPSLTLNVLSEVQDQFPLGFSTFDLWFARYEAGAGSEALLHDWKTEGDRLSEAVCATGVHLLGGNRFLVRRVRERCKQASGEGLGYLTTESEAPRWEQWLTLFGTRFRRVDLDGAVLFDSLAPRSMAGAERLSPAGWKAHANVGPGDEALAFDGRLETRWGSGGPQRRGMAFTIELPQATDISWLRIRMGSFTRDCARSLAVETSTDGDRWQRLEAPLMAKSIRWRDGVPEEHTDGNLDLWLDRRGVRFVRLVNLSEHPHLDWSIPELEIDGTPARESA